MAELDLSISQLPALTLPVQGSDLLHIARGGEDYSISRAELVKTLLSQISDANISGATSGQALVFSAGSGKWVNQFVSWASITGRPGTFPPIAHMHLWDEITDAPTELPPSAHQHAWTDLTGVPSSFPPDPHTHGWDDITGIPATFPPEAHAHAWSEITDKPTEFPPAAHDHASLYYSKTELNTSGAGGQVHWDNITSKPSQFGTGDMSKSVYDLNDDGIVDQATSIPWSGITGKPGTFPPDAHNHDDRYFTETELSQSGAGGSVHWDNITGKPATFGGDMAKAVYDLNNDGIVDSAASVPWTGITGKPATFPPSDHNHDDLYSLLGHNHNGLYSLLDHNHDDIYAALIHNHDASYAAIVHTHAQYLNDAPADGKIYGRKDGAWSEATSGDADTLDGYHASAFVRPASIREMLVADRTYYVSPTGLDSNDGLSSSTPFATIQKAVDVVASLDIKTHNVTIQLADGTYTGTVAVNGPWVGSGNVTITGNTSVPQNVVITANTNPYGKTLWCQGFGRINLSYFEIRGSAHILIEAMNGYISIDNIRLGSGGTHQLRASAGGYIDVNGPYYIVAGGSVHWAAVTGGRIRCQNKTVTLVGIPAFSGYFVLGGTGGIIVATLNTYSGTATGTRYYCDSNSILSTAGGGVPGTAATGSTATGGQYL